MSVSLRIVVGAVAVWALAWGGPCSVAAEAESAPLTLEQLLAKHAEARGGAERWKALRGLRLEGKWTAFSTSVPMTIWRQRPGGYRFDHVLFDKPVSESYDGEKAWVRGEMLGAPEGAELKEDWKRNVIQDGRFASPLLDPQAVDAKIELKGRGEVEGTEVYVLSVMPQDGPEETWYLDAESFLEVKRVSPTYDIFSGPGVQAEMESYFMDFREVGGVVLPFREERHFSTRYHVYEIEKATVDPEPMAAGFFSFTAAPPDGTAGD